MPFLLYFNQMENSEKQAWQTPESHPLGKAKDIIQGFSPADPKVLGGGDSDLANASDV